MQINERLLNDAGGWQVMKHARVLHGAGRVSEATYADGLLAGYVREGETQYRAGLKILSRSNMENLCTCRDSKLRGMICAHSIAVGLEVLKPTPKTKPPEEAALSVKKNGGRSRTEPRSEGFFDPDGHACGVARGFSSEPRAVQRTRDRFGRR